MLTDADRWMMDLVTGANCATSAQRSSRPRSRPARSQSAFAIVRESLPCHCRLVRQCLTRRHSSQATLTLCAGFLYKSPRLSSLPEFRSVRDAVRARPARSRRSSFPSLPRRLIDPDCSVPHSLRRSTGSRPFTSWLTPKNPPMPRTPRPRSLRSWPAARHSQPAAVGPRTSHQGGDRVLDRVLDSRRFALHLGRVRSQTPSGRKRTELHDGRRPRSPRRRQSPRRAAHRQARARCTTTSRPTTPADRRSSSASRLCNGPKISTTSIVITRTRSRRTGSTKPIAKECPKAHRAEAAYLCARTLTMAERYHDALPMLREALALNPDRAGELNRYLALAYFLQPDPDLPAALEAANRFLGVERILRPTAASTRCCCAPKSCCDSIGPTMRWSTSTRSRSDSKRLTETFVLRARCLLAEATALRKRRRPRAAADARGAEPLDRSLGVDRRGPRPRSRSDGLARRGRRTSPDSSSCSAASSKPPTRTSANRIAAASTGPKAWRRNCNRPDWPAFANERNRPSRCIAQCSTTSAIRRTTTIAGCR